jgi:hypothetical protein
MLRGWTLYCSGEAPYEVNPADHDLAARQALEAGAERVLLSLSTPLGIEALPPDEAQPLLDAWREGVLGLPEPFAGWAALSSVEPDLDQLTIDLKSASFVGLQVSATLLATPTAIGELGPVLRRCRELDKPVLVHPGPVAATVGTPTWWPAVVQYPAQLQAAWWAWQARRECSAPSERQAGLPELPELPERPEQPELHEQPQRPPSELPPVRICFVAGAGLAPVHHERFLARGGSPGAIDRNAFLETSSYGRQGVDALARALGIDVLVFGSDRPYAHPTDPQLGDAAWRALSTTNPTRLLEGNPVA